MKTHNHPVILVIEDEEEIAALAAYYLRRAGCRTRVARGGSEGMLLARELSPALVLCAASLADLNGLKVLMLLRSDPATRSIPQVLMSGPRAAWSGFPLADAFLEKPFTKERLVSVVREFARATGEADGDDLSNSTTA